MAAVIPGTLVYGFLSAPLPIGCLIRLSHPAGVLEVGAEVAERGGVVSSARYPAANREDPDAGAGLRLAAGKGIVWLHQVFESLPWAALSSSISACSPRNAQSVLSYPSLRPVPL